MRFDNIRELEDGIAELPGAEMRAIHLGKKLKQQKTPSERYEHLEQMDEDEKLTKYAQGIDREPEKEHVAIVNTGSGHVSATATPEYDIVQHAQAFGPLVDSLRDLGVEASGRIRSRSSRDRVVVQAVTEKRFEFNGESFGIGFQAKNSYNKKQSVQLRAFYYRELCSNGMILDKADFVRPYKRQHRGDVDVVEEYKDWMKELIESSGRMQEVLQQAVDDMFDDEKLLIVLKNAGLPKTKLRQIEDRIEADGGGQVSRKQLYDAVTNYVTHADVLQDVSFTTEERYHRKAQNLLFADRDKLVRPVRADQLPKNRLPESVDPEEDNLETVTVEATRRGDA